MRGPAPTYRPAFPLEFVEQANNIVHQRPVRSPLRQRAKLVLLFHHQPLVSNTAAAACVALPPHSVRLWRRRWANGHVVREDESGRGPQPRFSPSGSRRGHSPRRRSGVRDRKAVESPIAGRGDRPRRSGPGEAPQPQYGLAEAPRRCPQTLAVGVLERPPRPAVCRASGRGAGPVCGPLGWPPPRSQRPHRQCG
jgi:hypothetical protein